MTQEVQPLTWSKRTNIEEHQQFFSKINEIIGNLAPTVDEAEQAIAQATQALAGANAAITTANAASAAADAAAQQAQTAADTVAGYNTRLIAVEDEAAGNTANIVDLQDRMGTAEGKITAIEGREADYLKKTGASQTVTSQIMVPTTATGLRDTQIANGTRIQNDLDAYAPMVRDTGNKKIAGIKQFTAFNELIASASASGVQFTTDSLYMKIGSITRQLNAKLTITIGGGYTATCDIIEAMIHTFNISAHYGTYAAKHYNATSGVKLYIAANTGMDGFDIWIKMPSAGLTWIMVEAHVTAYGGSVTNDAAITPGDMVPAPDPSASYSQFSEVVMS